MPAPRDFLPPPPWEGPPIPSIFSKSNSLIRNPHGGYTILPFMVKSIDRDKAKTLMGIADTGSFYTSIPPMVVTELGLTYIGTERFHLGDGRIVESKMFVGIIEIEGKEIGTTFITMANGKIVIGVTDLEKLGFKVNPSMGTLEPTPIFG